MNKKNNTYPICFYKWKSITWPVKSFGDHTIDYPAELSIVLVDDVKEEQYDTTVKDYEDGEVENGVGEMATWSEKKNQLTFLYKRKLIHVHARTSGDVAANKVKTIKVAKLIAEKL